MTDNQVIVVGGKETFIPRVLVKKVQDSKISCKFVTWTVNEINANVNDSTIVVLYLEEGEKPPETALHFLIDTIEEKGLQMMIVGEQNDIDYIKTQVPSTMVYKNFSRPVDNQLFVETISDYFEKVESGDFKKSILIVDDDTRYMALVREWLKSTYKVSMANSGLQAIKFLGKNKVDLILLDHEMPVTGGPQVLEMLRSEPETASIPVMFLTGKGDKESVMEVVALKPEGYFLKSIQKDELLEKLQEFFILRR